MDERSMMYPSIDIDCETQEQADRLIELFNQVKKELEGQPINEETKMQMQMRLRDIQYQLDSDESYQGVSFKLNGGFAYNKSTWYLEDITAYHEFYCNDNATNYAIPSYIDVNNMLFDLKAAGVLQAYTPVIPCCISTILPRYEKPYPVDKTITVEVRYDARDKIDARWKRL